MNKKIGGDELATSGDEVGFWTKVGGVILSAFAACFGVWKHTQKRIDDLQESMKGKADSTEMNRQRDNIAELFRGQRADREAVLTAMQQHKDALHSLSTLVTSAISERPTRTEINGMLNQTKRGR